MDHPVFLPKPDIDPKDAWFRSPRWDAEARADFAAHLARARAPNRVQYRRIKAIALLGSGHPEWESAGYELLSQNATNPDARSFERVSACALMGTFDQERGRLERAERNLRDALTELESSSSGGDGLEAIRLAEVLLDRGGHDRLSEARDLVERQAKDPSIFVAGRFRLAVAAARIAVLTGRAADAARWADAALELAAATHSGLARHPTVGLVSLGDADRRWLLAVAAGTETRDLRQA